MTDKRIDAPGAGRGQEDLRGVGRLRRLIHGWSANLVQTLLGLTQQLLLIPAFLHFWTNDVLAAWIAIYSAGSLVVVADAGLQLRAINRFLAFKSCVDCEGRTASFYADMLQIYVRTVVALAAALILSIELFPPAAVLGFHTTPTFDSAMLVMTVGTLLSLPANLVSGLYRVRDKYGRAVWSLNAFLLLGQMAQLIAIAWFGSLLAVAFAYVATQILFAAFLVAYDAPRQLPFLRRGRSRKIRRQSWRWSIRQFGLAFPFAVANVAELMLVNVPVLLVSALVVDRVAVLQWGLTRVITSFVRGVCTQVTLPLAAELGHDYVIGDKERMRRLYANGSVFVTAIASVIVAGLLPFWSDFFALWTHGSIPDYPPLAVTLLLGSAIAAPSLLALAFANHSNRVDLLVRTKGLQLVVFLVLSLLMIPRHGPLGAAIAIVASDLLTQFGILTFVIMRQTLKYPLHHMTFLATIMLAIIFGGWGLGLTIRSVVPGMGLQHFLVECALWLAIVGAAASPFLMKRIREACLAVVPN